MRAGLIGLPSVGKKTLFKLLTKLEVTENIASRAKNSIGMSKLNDVRVVNLGNLYKPKKVTPAFIEFILIPDIPTEEEKKKQIFSEASEVDLIIHLVRAFKSDRIYHVKEEVNPDRDIEDMNNDIILSDLFIVEKRIERIEKELQRRREEEKEKELKLLTKFKGKLEEGLPLRELALAPEEEKAIRGFNFLSLKKMLIILNIDEGSLSNNDVLDNLKDKYESDYIKLLVVSVKIEEEISELEEDDRKSFMDDMGIKESALDRIVMEAYALLSLISFFTVVEDEVKAWTIRSGINAKTAAGKIHSDMERGFIRAEVMKYDILMKFGSESALKSQGEYFVKGKEYVVEDGDIIHFRFSV
jgi:GTP-binding protein YchF